MTINNYSISVIIPTFNGEQRIEKCINALSVQDYGQDFEIIVVDDGSIDNTVEVLTKYSNVKVISQNNQGPAAARNNGASQASGEIILFTDDDCIPQENWLSEMLLPFKDENISGVKGAYKSTQKSPVARFVQYEYEEKYRYMNQFEYIDFIDTYSAAYKKEVFRKFNGFNADFPVACAEDVELSFRIANAGHKLVFNPNAIVEHFHPDTLIWYIKKKFKFAFWRMAAIKLQPNKAKGDSHTPNTMKIQLALFPFLLLFPGAIFSQSVLYVSVIAVVAYVVTLIPSIALIILKDPLVAVLSPFLYLCRSGAQFFGVLSGLIFEKTKI